MTWCEEAKAAAPPTGNEHCRPAACVPQGTGAVGPTARLALGARSRGLTRAGACLRDTTTINISTNSTSPAAPSQSLDIPYQRLHHGLPAACNWRRNGTASVRLQPTAPGVRAQQRVTRDPQSSDFGSAAVLGHLNWRLRLAFVGQSGTRFIHCDVPAGGSHGAHERADANAERGASSKS